MFCAVLQPHASWIEEKQVVSKAPVEAPWTTAPMKSCYTFCISQYLVKDYPEAFFITNTGEAATFQQQSMYSHFFCCWLIKITGINVCLYGNELQRHDQPFSWFVIPFPWYWPGIFPLITWAHSTSSGEGILIRNSHNAGNQFRNNGSCVCEDQRDISKSSLY